MPLEVTEAHSSSYYHDSEHLHVLDITALKLLGLKVVKVSFAPSITIEYAPAKISYISPMHSFKWRLVRAGADWDYISGRKISQLIQAIP